MSVRGWLYLVVFIDLYSRRVVGWALSSALDHRVALVALQRAVVHRRPPRGLIIHSDRGVQGGFKQSSQHLDYEELRWERRSEGEQLGDTLTTAAASPPNPRK